MTTTLSNAKLWFRSHWGDALWLAVVLAFLANITYLLLPTPPSITWVRSLPAAQLDKAFPDLATASDDELAASLGALEVTPARRASHGQSSAKVLKKVNLNTASYADLQHLPNVGPAMARKIIAHRKKLGRFSQVEQLLDVPGIGPKKLAKMKPYCLL